MEGMLYIVPTPVGNLKDITYRAIEVLKSSDYIYCEDTRTSAVFLNFYDIKTERRSFHKFNERSKVDEIIDLVYSGKTISVISDAGTPGISDPCGILVSEIDAKFVRTLPGATAFVPALVNSGLSTDEFTFIGFLPPKKNERMKKLESLLDMTQTLIFYESPHRAEETLLDMQTFFKTRNAALVREISKIYEETVRFNFSEIPFDKITFKGEMVILVEGGEEKAIDIWPRVRELMESGMSAKSILKQIKEEYKNEEIKRNEIYDFVLKNSKE